MRVFVNLIKPARFFSGLLLLFSASFVSAESGYFAVRHTETVLRDHVYYLNADLEYRFNTTLRNALKNGVHLPIVVNIWITREREYWFDADVANIIQSYRFSYSALTEQYLLHNLNSDVWENFNSLEAALSSLRTITELPLIDKQLIEGSNPHWVYVKTYLDIESLPAPLRPVAYFSNDWRLVSNTFLCPLAK
jgi:hypothetical protein